MGPNKNPPISFFSKPTNGAHCRNKTDSSTALVTLFLICVTLVCFSEWDYIIVRLSRLSIVAAVNVLIYSILQNYSVSLADGIVDLWLRR